MATTSVGVDARVILINLYLQLGVELHYIGKTRCVSCKRARESPLLYGTSRTRRLIVIAFE